MYQQNGASAHNNGIVVEFLNMAWLYFGQQMSLDFYLWGAVLTNEL